MGEWRGRWLETPQAVGRIGRLFLRRAQRKTRKERKRDIASSQSGLSGRNAVETERKWRQAISETNLTRRQSRPLLQHQHALSLASTSSSPLHYSRPRTLQHADPSSLRHPFQLHLLRFRISSDHQACPPFFQTLFRPILAHRRAASQYFHDRTLLRARLAANKWRLH